MLASAWGKSQLSAKGKVAQKNIFLPCRFYRLLLKAENLNVSSPQNREVVSDNS